LIFYVTYNDLPSGIFSSQVIDTVKFLNAELNGNVKLISFISFRNFFTNRRKIIIEKSDALVLPMFPGFHRFRFNVFLLLIVTLIFRPNCIIGRSVLATHLGFLLRKIKMVKTVIYDGRGAIEAEWKEYKVVANYILLSTIRDLEKSAVLNSDFRISVSYALVDYWKVNFNYNKQEHVIIPCTLNKVFENVLINAQSIQISRDQIGVNKDDILFVYSGSVAGWQSFNLLYEFMKKILKVDLDIKLLFLSEEDSNITKLKKEFKEQIICRKVNANEVPEFLLAADYGLLIREESTTNLVASPVKFAEYLACGLQVIISDKLGDYSKFVIDKNCGYLFSQFINPHKIEIYSKNKNSDLALGFFTKKYFIKEYIRVLNS
jgi:glycosyltransferase involved in cell wall biosynthesis